MEPNPFDNYTVEKLVRFLKDCHGLRPETKDALEKESICGKTFIRFLDDYLLDDYLLLPIGERKCLKHLIWKERECDIEVFHLLEKILGCPVNIVKFYRAIGLGENTIDALIDENYTSFNVIFLEKTHIEKFPEADWQTFHHNRTELLWTIGIVKDFLKDTPDMIDWTPEQVELFLKKIFGQGWRTLKLFQCMSGKVFLKQEANTYEKLMRYDNFLRFCLVHHYLVNHAKRASPKVMPSILDFLDLKTATNYISERQGEETTPKRTLNNFTENSDEQGAQLQPGAALESANRTSIDLTEPPTAEFELLQLGMVPRTLTIQSEQIMQGPMHQLKAMKNPDCCSRLTSEKIQHAHSFDQDISVNCNYTKGFTFHCFETARTNLLQPIHEFKLLPDTCSEGKRLLSGNIMYRALPYACACLNSRQNGTIHFGIADEKRENVERLSLQPREVVGIEVADPEDFKQYLLQYSRERLIECFETDKKDAVEHCIRDTRFIRVVEPGNTEKCTGPDTRSFVIEFDIIPVHPYTARKMFRVKPPSDKPPSGENKKWNGLQAWIREHDKNGEVATKCIKNMRDYYENICPNLDELRRKLESTSTSNEDPTLWTQSMDGGNSSPRGGASGITVAASDSGYFCNEDQEPSLDAQSQVGPISGGACGTSGPQNVQDSAYDCGEVVLQLK